MRYARSILGAIIGAAIWLALVAMLSTVGRYARTPGMAGEVHCVDGFPKMEPPLPNLKGLARAENVRHEATHAAQFATGCDSVARAWEADPAFRLELEAEAFCVGVRVWPDSVQRARRWAFTATLASSYLNSLGNTLGFEDVQAALERWCHDS